VDLKYIHPPRQDSIDAQSGPTDQLEWRSTTLRASVSRRPRRRLRTTAG
jgi:hypothetical protein